MPEPGSSFVSGLEGVVAARTSLSHPDGSKGELLIGGFPVEELAPNASYEEVVHLLWHGELPRTGELAHLQDSLRAYRRLPDATLELLRRAAAADVPPMDALRMAAATLSIPTPGVGDLRDPWQQALVSVARFPTAVAAHHRLRQGLDPVEPDPDLGHAASYLHMLRGEAPSDAEARALETYLNTVSDHGMNASTFTARVIVSTGSDLISACTGAVGALKGPLHGGAPGPVLDMLESIREEGDPEAWIRAALDRGDRIMGFGHRVYKVRDPRAAVLSAAAEALYESGVDRSLYDLARRVEEVAVKVLDEAKPGRNLRANVEFYTALVLHGVGLPTDLFSPTFAVGRVAGWTAHGLEQRREGRLIRPSSEYVGKRRDAWVPMPER